MYTRAAASLLLRCLRREEREAQKGVSEILLQ